MTLWHGLRFLPLFALCSLATAACEDPPECRQDEDCGSARVCVAGQCVECGSSANCDADEFCCQGVCRPDAELEERCGCGASPDASAGQDCGATEASSVCLVGDAVATAATVAQGTCGCSCTPAEGGPICGPPSSPGGAPVCSCDSDGGNSACRRASTDAQGRPHRVADTCTPADRCVCFSTGAASVCDPNGATPDCTSVGGCASLVDDPANCGVPGRNCLVAETGLVSDGACIRGGCLCDIAEDCVGGNVNTCTYLPGERRASCVCSSYTAAGVLAPCPMELECATGGCVLDGRPFATESELRGVLGLP